MQRQQADTERREDISAAALSIIFIICTISTTRMLTVSLLVCAMMALTKASDDEIVNITTVAGEAGNHTISLFEKKAVVCPGGWNNYGGRCFYYETTKKTWVQAETNCQTLGGNLASFHSEREQNFIQSMTSDIVWLGGSGCQEAGAWFWIDGTHMDLKSWCEAKPDNSIAQCCMQMDTGEHNCWDDISCGNTHQSICAMTPK